MHKILVTWKYFGFGDKKENIERLFSRHNCVGELLSLEEAFPRLEEFEGIIVGINKITPEILDKAPNLRVIMKYGVGTDNIDKEAAKERNIKVFNLPGINCDAVAELILGLILALARKIVIADKLLRKGELALVIKDKIKDVSIEKALSHVLGITPLNDVPEREMSYDYTQVTYCKSFDTFTSFGPVIDTEIDPDDAVVRTYLNGEKVQEGHTKDLIFSCAYIVSYFSKSRTLFPGDIISTGTPSHVLGMRDGGKVEVEIKGIDYRLINNVYDPKMH